MSDSAHAELRTADGRPPRIALVDGNRASAMVLTVLTEAFGCWPLAVTNAEAALALVRRDALIDLVVIDLGLPDMDGVVAAQLIHALGRDLPILGLAPRRSRPRPAKERAAGLSAVLAKPYSPGELYNAMVAALGRLGKAARFYN
jgi:CheY-like chemotaxis protein